MGVDYNIVVEEQEYQAYKDVCKGRVLILDKTYQDEYETCDDLGRTKSVGAGAARNFAWQHSIDEGHAWHWVMDDNIQCFYRLNNNKIIRINSPLCFKIMEDFATQFENVAMAGPNYEMFVMRRKKVPPFITNTRIYSCNFIKNDLPFRWRGRYNEDTDISLRILKAGLCTIQYNAILQKKTGTQKLKGGNTDEFYAKEGTYNKSKMQVELHPDISRIVNRYGRVHHHVDYSVFRRIPLRLKKGLVISDKVNEYGLTLIEKEIQPLV